MAEGHRIAQRVAHRLVIIVSIFIDEHKVDLHAQRPIKLMGLNRLADTGDLPSVPNVHQNQRQISGNSESPEGFPRTGGCLASGRVAEREVTVEQQRGQALQLAVAPRVHAQKAQHGLRLHP